MRALFLVLAIFLPFIVASSSIASEEGARA
jgi:hypothetical protein